jgi:hypothetical protein
MRWGTVGIEFVLVEFVHFFQGPSCSVFKIQNSNLASKFNPQFEWPAISKYYDCGRIMGKVNIKS